jgi:hypothetical protein
VVHFTALDLLPVLKEVDLWSFILKVWICKKLLLYDCNSDQLLTFFSFCHHFWVGATAKQQQTHPKVMTE